MSASNPFADPALVAHYEAWYQVTGRRADRLEKALLKRLLAGFPRASTILEVGCGTGHFTRWFAQQALRPTGLDLSRPMLAEAVRLRCPPCVHGHALALPFSSGAFDLVSLVTTLEFLPQPVQALSEALRVARRGLVLGVLNRQSPLGRHLRREGGPIWGIARFFTPAKLIDMVQAAAGKPTKTVWRTTIWPVWPGVLPLPWGGFIGMAVMLPGPRQKGGNDRDHGTGQPVSFATGVAGTGDWRDLASPAGERSGGGTGYHEHPTRR